MRRLGIRWHLPIAMAVLSAFFTLLFYVDNKYQTPPPYGKSGVITLHEQDLKRSRPLFLIDGWLLTDERTTDQPTYIGEFSNLQRGNLSVSPHGRAGFRLTLRYDGAPLVVSAEFPQLASRYAISLDGTPLAQGVGNGLVSFLLTPGDHVLLVETSSETGYYSGMYFPPALSTARTLPRLQNIRSFAYCAAFVLPLVLAAFTLFLWRTGGSISRWFALLCLSYALYMFRYFVFLFSMPAAPYWFAVQSLALYCLCFCVVKLTFLASGVPGSQIWRIIRAFLLGLPALLLALCLLIPILPWAVSVHGRLTDLYYILTFCFTACFVIWNLFLQNGETFYILTGCSVFGTGLFLNLLFSNRFEPIYFFWQFEWCGLFLVLLFAAMMISRNRRILRENDTLTNHLEEQVKKRTGEVTQLLQERKAFFSDMAHDLKAPVFATQSFIQAIRRSSVGVDAELRGYLDLAEAKQQEMARRLQGLSTINALDRIEEEKIPISLRELLAEIYAVHHGETEVRSVHLAVQAPEQDAFLKAQPEKLNILFENLIYNALKATPPEGTITISARSGHGRIQITVADTGCGIPEEELPLIFRRFYVGANNKSTGTGLGLYIVHSIVTELDGTISVSSSVGRGTVFTMDFPEEI